MKAEIVSVVLALTLCGCLSEPANMTTSTTSGGEIRLQTTSTISTSTSSTTHAPAVNVGVVRECNWSMGEDACGKCYCVETDKGCEIVEYSEVGDLGFLVDKRIRYTVSGEDPGAACSKMCPCYIVLGEVMLLPEHTSTSTTTTSTTKTTTTLAAESDPTTTSTLEPVLCADVRNPSPSACAKAICSGVSECTYRPPGGGCCGMPPLCVCS